MWKPNPAGMMPQNPGMINKGAIPLGMPKIGMPPQIGMRPPIPKAGGLGSMQRLHILSGMR